MPVFSNHIKHAGIASACVLMTFVSACDKSTNNALAPAPSTTIGTDVDDSVTTTKVRSAFMADDYIKSLDVKIKVRKGEVLLSGFVDSQSQIDRSIAVAKGIEGVRNVTSELAVKQGTQTVGNKIDDSAVTSQVKAALLADATVKSLDISVTTRKGEVELSGFVDNETQMTHALDVATHIDGVISVINHMSVKK